MTRGKTKHKTALLLLLLLTNIPQQDVGDSHNLSAWPLTTLEANVQSVVENNYIKHKGEFLMEKQFSFFQENYSYMPMNRGVPRPFCQDNTAIY